MKLVYYHPDQFPKLAQYKGVHQDHPYWELCARTWAPIFDRTGTLDAPFHQKIIYPMPEKKAGRPRDLHVAIDNRAKYLIKKAKDEDRKIIVYWSGGIDSTTVLAALLRNGINTEDLVVRMNRFSIIEHQRFYQKFIEGKLHVETVGPNVKNSLTVKDLEDNLVVTGELGDQLFSSVVNRAYYNSDMAPCPSCEKVYIKPDGQKGKMYDVGTYLLLEEPWEPFVQAFFYGMSLENYDILAPSSERVMEFIKPFAEKCPFPIKNALDFWWWLNYAGKWQGVTFRFCDHLDLTEETYRNLVPFFDDHDMERWAMNKSNHQKKKMRLNLVTKDDPQSGNHSIKWYLKSYIYRKFDKDEHYKNSKSKIGSLPMVQTSNWWFRTDDFKRISHERFNKPEVYDKIYGDQFDAIWK